MAIFRNVAQPFYFLVLIAASYQAVRFKRVLTLSWVTVIGGMCYSIYLIHLPLIALIAPLTTRIEIGTQAWPNLLLQMALIAPPVVACCAVFFACVERPCMQRDWPARLRAWVLRRN